MKIRLRVAIAPETSVRTFEHTGPSLVIGRDPACDLSFASEGTPIASWRHAQIDLLPNGAVLTDLNSTNGTFLNEEQLSAPTSLTVGDVIRLGRRGPKMKVIELVLTEPPRPVKSRPVPAPPAGGSRPRQPRPAPALPPLPVTRPADLDVASTLDFPADVIHNAATPQPVVGGTSLSPFGPPTAPKPPPPPPKAPLPRPASSIPAPKPPPRPPEVATAPIPPIGLPEQFGRYRILKQLGKGSMGAVYLAHDTQLDRPVALKVPSFAPEEDATMRDRFYREARSAATLQHPCICSVFDVGEIDRILYLTMAHIEGKPLSQVLKERSPLLLAEAAELTRKMAEAMDEAHSRDVIHRDLKPSNILVNRRGDPVLIDFGLARREGKNDVRLTATGAILGTPAYMPPELASGHASLAGRSCDIYSLGVILYEMVTGQIPFRGSLGSVLNMILTQDPPPVTSRRPDADAQIEEICRKAMAKKPEDRFATMGEFAQAMDDYLRSNGGRR